MSEAKVIQRVEEKLTAVDIEEIYADALNDTGAGCCDFCDRYGRARVLKEVDPIAYQCGLNDYEDTMREQYEEINGQWYDINEVENIREEIADEEDGE